MVGGAARPQQRHRAGINDNSYVTEGRRAWGGCGLKSGLQMCSNCGQLMSGRVSAKCQPRKSESARLKVEPDSVASLN